MSHNKIRSQKRNINGVLLLDKPIDITANHALQMVKRLYSAQKAGHTGSLDPLATGMLPLCFGEGTKFSQFLLNADKSYLVTGRLGVKTNTGDAEGQVIETRDVPSFTQEHLLQILEKFKGAVQQVPSMFSALKHQGKPLYELARQGITIDRPAREVQIYTLDLLAHDANSITMFVQCSKGTYIRTLVEDIGEMLGCGAHVIMLRRTQVGPYREEQMVSMAQLEAIAEQNDFAQLDKLLLPVDSALEAIPKIEISEVANYYLKRGQSIIVPRAPTSGWVRIFHQDGSFLGMGEIMEDGRVAPRRMVQSNS